ncbi:hypothetical protein BC830DRAFT_1168576 [Chytriomyces sp. MP71]|nr:hypothetical protein BC830DRAFT_1168576 [Chytriomyces sp. MP71]
MLQLIAFSFRTRAERVVWCLNELGLEYEVVRISPSHLQDTSSSDHARLASVNPLLKVPALVHKLSETEPPFVITESLAIMRYLASLPTTPVKLVPENPQEAARMDERILIGLTQMDVHLWLMYERTGLHRDTIPEGMVAHSSTVVKKCMETYTNKWLLESEFIAGDSFTLADILFCHLIDWTLGMQVVDTLEPHVVAYLARMAARPGYPQLWKAGFQ